MDFRKFLQQPADAEPRDPTSGSRAADEPVLPYFGGAYVQARDRRLRLRLPGVLRAHDRPQLKPGFYRFAVAGRTARLLGPAESPPLDELKAVRGHLLGTRLVLPSGEVEPLYCLPEEVPPRCSPLRARRWPTGDLLFDQLEFESDAEELARRALQDGRPLAGIKGVPASLRAVFAYTLGERAAQRLHIAVCPLELLPAVADIAEHGMPAAEQALLRLQEERRAYARAHQRELQEQAAAAVAAIEPRRRPPEPRPSPPPLPRPYRRPALVPTDLTAEDRAEQALHAAGATLLEARGLARGQLEVTYRFHGQRFVSIVDAATLQVIDAGVCLAGADRMVTLQSLPSVLKEAIETHRLVITRRDPGDALDDEDD
jgi:hypothetical protein